MKLLIFAHKGEASHFISKLNFKPLPFIFNGLYSNGKDLLLLTGEGLQNATEKTAIVLTKYSKEISQLVNIGIAGSLNLNLKIDESYLICESFKESADSIDGKKFKFTNSSEFKCISANNRVLDIIYAKKLAAHADLVDRELWAIASCAKIFKVQVIALKLISDNALIENSKDICIDIKARAREMSEKLFKKYLELEA